MLLYKKNRQVGTCVQLIQLYFFITTWIQLDSNVIHSFQLYSTGFNGAKWIQLDSSGIRSIQLDSTDLKWIQLDSTGIRSIQLDSTLFYCIYLVELLHWSNRSNYTEQKAYFVVKVNVSRSIHILPCCTNFMGIYSTAYRPPSGDPRHVYLT